MKRTIVAAIGAALLTTGIARAEDATVTYKSLAPDIAFEMARAALDQCRKDGFQVAVVVIDRFGQPLVVLRDRFAGLGAITIATGKAWTSVNFSRDSSEVVKAIQSGQMSAALANAPNVMALGGGMIVKAGGSIVGGIGIAGAPGGDKDEACAKAGIAAVQDKLDF
jgi:uncharacterized protein GlcG (DUF336 family)